MMNGMIKRTASILQTALLMLCVAACNENRIALNDAPDIRFGLHVSDGEDSKALLESADLLKTGTQVQVYGFAEADLKGHDEHGNEGTTFLNQGQILQYSEGSGSTPGSWSFTSGELYQWKLNQEHTFFGWLTKDAKSNIEASTFFGDDFTFSSNELTIPAKTLGISATNFDFAYSDVVTRGATAADYSTVDLALHHLFASFGLSAVNYSTKTVIITGIELHGLQDGKSATIDYSGSTVGVAYAGGNITNPTLLSTSLTLAAAGNSGDVKANVVGTPSTTPAYFLVWPQTDLKYDGTLNDGNPAPVAADANEPYLKISYTQDGHNNTAYAAIPSDDGVWSAGVRYELELSFRDREIDLTFAAAPWDKLDPIIDYNGAVSVTQKLHLAKEFYNNCTLSADGKTAYLKPGIPVILEFAIGSPQNATWLVGEELDFDAFDVYNYPDGARTSPDQNISAQGLVDGNTVKIAIDPPTGDLQKNEFYLELTFTVRLNNGEMVSILPKDIFADHEDVDNDEDHDLETCPTRFVYIKM